MPGAFLESSDPVVRHRNPCEIATRVIRDVGNQPALGMPQETLADDLKRISLVDNPEHSRFFGTSSGAMLVHTAIDLKNEYTGGSGDEIRRRILGSRREEFWTLRPWERAGDTVPKASFAFPEDDLMTSLVDHYFTKVNLLLPLLHRPSFERSIIEGLHLRHDGFGATVLLVCAVASRFSDDPRVRIDGVDSFHSAGWKCSQRS
ncbi:hypothetical protein DXG03_002393 [Asterophora parasitica]|uniref:Uncharacterized protein n=1 Tax=Asterophora parasitica TaxID=117018 RepID=A0A9P7KGC9_9AGAR|nr:hypothetical protein DXG03_002393 [Asterophora parasitica]